VSGAVRPEMVGHMCWQADMMDSTVCVQCARQLCAVKTSSTCLGTQFHSAKAGCTSAHDKRDPIHSHFILYCHQSLTLLIVV
jgi:hypothetical protein